MKITVPLTLASGSPRRKQLLHELGLEFKVEVKETDESIPKGIPRKEVPVALALRKAIALRDTAENSLVITADTIVLLGKKILNKPADREEAIAMLKALSGKTHKVITGVCLNYRDHYGLFHATTAVTFRKLKRQEIEYYVDTFKPFDKAGAYAIQEWIGMTGIREIRGDYYNVVGLPAGKLYRKLFSFAAQLGILKENDEA